MRYTRKSIVILGAAVAASTAALFAAPSTQPTTKPAAAMACCMDKAGAAGEAMACKNESMIPALFDRATEVSDIENGLRFRFATQPGLLADLVKVIESEDECCQGLTATLTAIPGQGEVTLELTGDATTAETLRKM